MATKQVVLTGTAKWARVFEDNRDMNGFEGAYVDCDGAYSIDVFLDKANKQKLKDSGSIKRGKFDDDGNFSVKFTRKHTDRFEWASGAPKVTKLDGSVWSFEDDGPIGNDSEVEITLSVYTTSYNPGTRLEAVKVIKAVAIDEDGAKDEGVTGDTGW